MPKKCAKVQTEHDTRIREGMAAVLTHRSTREAAKATGIPRSTLDLWRNSAEGMAILDELSRSDDGAARVQRIWGLVDKMLDQLSEAIDGGKIPPTALAVNIGILCDKAKAMAPRTDQTTGETVVSVRFGGVRVRAGEGDAGPTGDAAGAEVVVRRTAGGA